MAARFVCVREGVERENRVCVFCVLLGNGVCIHYGVVGKVKPCLQGGYNFYHSCLFQKEKARYFASLLKGI